VALTNTSERRAQTVPAVRRRQAQPSQKGRVRTEQEIALAHRRVKERLAWLGTLAIALALTLGIVARYSYIVKTNYAVDQLRESLHNGTNTTARLEAEKYSLASPQRIMDIAINKLGMRTKTSKVGGGGQ